MWTFYYQVFKYFKGEKKITQSYLKLEKNITLLLVGHFIVSNSHIHR